MTRDNSSDNQTKIVDENKDSMDQPESNSDSGISGLNLLSLVEKGNSAPRRESIELAAAGDISALLPPGRTESSQPTSRQEKIAPPAEDPVIRKSQSIEEFAAEKSWQEFPGNKIDGEDPYAEPRELAYRHHSGARLSFEETAQLESWWQFPGLDKGSADARALMQLDILTFDTLTEEEKGRLYSWQEFPNPDKSLDRARELAFKNNDRSLKKSEKAELCAWNSFYNPDPKYDRPRELVRKATENGEGLTVAQKAELASWLDFPGLDKQSTSMRELARKEYFNPDNGLEPSEIAKLEAGKMFTNPDKRLDSVRKLVEQQIASNYKIDGAKPLTNEQLAELKVWYSLPDPNKYYDEARQLMKAEITGTEPTEEQVAVIAKAQDVYKNPPEPVYKEPNKNFYQRYEQFKPDLNKEDPRRRIRW
ncbi:MAG: hypothetical protein K2W82_04655 [Candidatus Obscuribacterales bacterium]|nr:hypothetical protein [Candidatus Obscuribacterales bacterium]